jgi:hypothetical protein
MIFRIIYILLIFFNFYFCLADDNINPSSSPSISLLDNNKNYLNSIDKVSNPNLYNLIEKYGKICSLNNNNNVRKRGDIKWTAVNKSIVHNFSLIDEVIRFSSDINSIDKDIKCNNISSFIKSIANGERTCTLGKLIPPNEICNIMNNYSSIFWYGNSHTRHTIMALQSLISEDLQHGAVHRLVSM